MADNSLGALAQVFSGQQGLPTPETPEQELARLRLVVATQDREIARLNGMIAGLERGLETRPVVRHTEVVYRDRPCPPRRPPQTIGAL